MNTGHLSSRSGCASMVPMHWEFSPQWAAWWLMFSDSPVTARRGYGPFTEREAVIAGEFHGVPFGSRMTHTQELPQ